MISKASRDRSGFTLLEIMASVALLAIIFTFVMQARAGAMNKAANARLVSIASRLGLTQIRRIEAGMMPDLYDGYEGDFSEEGHGQFTYVIGLGDGSQFAAGGEDPTEEVWRRFLSNEEDDRDDEEMQPEFERVFFTITFPSVRDGEEFDTLTLETLIDTWAVYQDFDLYRTLWPNLDAEELE
jgi:prepilin-type N-terminal cleavage/methylation domain-containing protein